MNVLVPLSILFVRLSQLYDLQQEKQQQIHNNTETTITTNNHIRSTSPANTPTAKDSSSTSSTSHPLIDAPISKYLISLHSAPHQHQQQQAQQHPFLSSLLLLLSISEDFVVQSKMIRLLRRLLPSIIDPA